MAEAQPMHSNNFTYWIDFCGRYTLKTGIIVVLNFYGAYTITTSDMLLPCTEAATISGTVTRNLASTIPLTQWNTKSNGMLWYCNDNGLLWRKRN
jgi:hypothetical protein